MVSSPLTGPDSAVVASPSLAPPPTVSPPQAATPVARASVATAAASAAFLRSGLLSMAPHLLLDSGLARLLGRLALRIARLAHDVHLLKLPAQDHADAASGQPLPLRLAGVGNEDGHPHVPAEVDDYLRRRAQVDRALDHALDPRPAAVPRLRLPVGAEHLDVELLRAHDRVAALAGGQPLGRNPQRRPMVEPHLPGACDLSR